VPSGQCYEVDKGTTILIAAIRNGLHLPHDCTEAICGTDRVKILYGQQNLSAKSENEELTLTMLSAGPHDRLGCVAQILGDVTVGILS
jgi:ferredoxin